MEAIIRNLKENHKLELILLLSLSMLFSIFLVGFRAYVSETRTYLFLIWNLFLALIPFMISFALVCWEERIKSTLLLWIAIGIWLLFFPNAPYILTDLFHLRYKHHIPLWYDLILILFFAWNGLILGFLSLRDVQKLIGRRFSEKIGWGFAITALVMASLGVYIGRYLRWNSWDILVQPWELLRDIIHRLINPFAYTETFGMTILFAIFLMLGYLTFTQLLKSES